MIFFNNSIDKFMTPVIVIYNKFSARQEALPTELPGRKQNDEEFIR